MQDQSKRAGSIQSCKAVPDADIVGAMENGIAVRPYTVNKEKDMKRLFEIKCSALITDYPEKAYKLREKYA